MRRDKVICPCRHITVGNLQDAVAAGAIDFCMVQQATGVAKSCCRCREHAQLVVEAILEERKLEENKKEPSLF